MYSFLVIAAPKDEQAYEFFTYKGRQKVELNYRGKPVFLERGMRFGVRPSSNGKHIRLIFPNEKNKVFTIDLKTAQKIARNLD